MYMKESQIQNAILEFLLYNGVFCWRSNNVPVYDQTAKRYRRMPKFSLKGVADILGIYKGRPLAIEVKKERQYPSREQYAFLNQY